MRRPELRHRCFCPHRIIASHLYSAWDALANDKRSPQYQNPLFVSLPLDSDDYEEYSEDDFDSFEDSSELSWGGKRLNSPVKRPKSKDGALFMQLATFCEAQRRRGPGSRALAGCLGRVSCVGF